MKDSRMPSSGAVPSGSYPLATNLHQVGKRIHKEKHSRVGVSKLPSSSSRFDAQLISRLSSYVKRNPRPKVVSVAPQIKWKCPPSFCPDDRWLVAAGEESQEVTYQRHRETIVEKAVYSSPIAIPLNPFTVAGLEAEHHDDSLTPVVPLIPVEELVDNTQKTDVGFNVKITEDAAATVVAAPEKEGSIDMQLLINILSDPQMVKKLMNGVRPWVEGKGETSNPARSEPGGMQQHVEPLIPSTSRPAGVSGAIRVEKPVKLSTSKPDVESIKRPIQDYGARDAYVISPPMAPINHFTSRLVPHIAEATWVRPYPSMLSPTLIPPPFPTNYIPPPHFCPPAHIMNFNREAYGMKHGTEKQNLSMSGQYGHFIQGLGSAHNPTTEKTNLKSREPCHKPWKLCAYFRSSGGCRNGPNCHFKHE